MLFLFCYQNIKISRKFFILEWETFLLDCGVRDEPENFMLSRAEKFWSEGLDQNLLYRLNDTDLKELGISRMGDRKKILLKIEALVSIKSTKNALFSPVLSYNSTAISL